MEIKKDVVKGYGKYYLVSTNLTVLETGIFECDAKGNVIEWDELFIKTYTTREEAEQKHIEIIKNIGRVIPMNPFDFNITRLELSADTKQNRFTMVYQNEFGYPVVNHVTIDSINYSPYAQYKDAFSISYKGKGKRSVMAKVFKHNSDYAIYKGWVDLDGEAFKEQIAENASTLGNPFDKESLSKVLNTAAVKPIIKYSYDVAKEYFITDMNTINAIQAHAKENGGTVYESILNKLGLTPAHIHHTFNGMFKVRLTQYNID